MSTNTRTREELKQFFRQNAIPTESQFWDWIDAGLIQRDDGIARPAGEPLRIEASGAADSADPKAALALFESFENPHPDWVLRLTPRADDASPRPGLSIGDAHGASSLFIDGATGRVGIGLENPQCPLHIRNGSDADLEGGGYLILGKVGGENIVFDDNEIMARKNMKPSILYLQKEGGTLDIRGDIKVHGKKPIIFERYTLKSTKFDTKYLHSRYSAAIVGLAIFKESRSPNIQYRAFLAEVEDNWHILVQNYHSTVKAVVDVMFVSKKWTAEKGPWKREKLEKSLASPST